MLDEFRFSPTLVMRCLKVILLQGWEFMGVVLLYKFQFYCSSIRVYENMRKDFCLFYYSGNTRPNNRI